jgi:tRNA nucleotidyltransferase (CCA-adding enzyme)
MVRKSTPLPQILVPLHPGREILRLAALLAEGDALDEDTLDLMFEQMETGVVADVAPSDVWAELARGLMARSPALMIQALRECGVLEIVLPEVASLFGVPQIADEPAEVDIGEHLLKALTEAARCAAPLEVRFALLTMNVGKADSPREHLPVHYRHIERGRPRIEAICERFVVPETCREVALLALAECERVHRVSEVRAGPVAALLDRVGAFSDPARFALLMSVCSCDYFAYGRRSAQPYPKALLLDAALKVCADLGERELEAAESMDDVQTARAVAIAEAFRSQRWSSGAT